MEPSHLSSEELPRIEPEASTSNDSTSASDTIDLSIQKEKHFDDIRDLLSVCIVNVFCFQVARNPLTCPVRSYQE